MNPLTRQPTDQEVAADRAIGVLQQLLAKQRAALVAGDLQGMQTAQSQLHALLVNPAWQKAATGTRSAQRLRDSLRAVAVNADLALRGEAHARRGLSALGAGPAVYGAAGNLSAYGGSVRKNRGVAA